MATEHIVVFVVTDRGDPVVIAKTRYKTLTKEHRDEDVIGRDDHFVSDDSFEFDSD